MAYANAGRKRTACNTHAQEMKDIEAAQKEAKKARREAEVVANSREAAVAALKAAAEYREACVSLCELRGRPGVAW